MRTADQAATRDWYRERWLRYGYDSRTLGWDRDCQWVRFEAAFEGLRDDEFGSVLDMGCGFGDLLGYLRERGWRGRYTGVDLVEELIAEARRQYAGDAGAEFVCDDAQSVALAIPHDCAVAIGMFNHQLADGHLEFVRLTVEKLWSATTKVVVCDFLSNSADPGRRRPDLYYADPQQILGLAAGHSRRVMIHHAYMPFEFQVKIWHDDSFGADAPVFIPRRHLAAAQSEWRTRRQGTGPRQEPPQA